MLSIFRKTAIGLSLVTALSLGTCAEAEIINGITPERENQLALLARQNFFSETSKTMEQAISEGGYFAVTDLDNNQRLEILFTSSACDGSVISNWGYEVNESENDTYPLNFMDGSYEVNIKHPELAMYYACQLGLYYYTAGDTSWSMTDDGKWAHSGGVFSMYLENGRIHRSLLGGFYGLHKDRDNPNEEILYFDHNANIIPFGEYANLLKNYYIHHHPFWVTVDWRPVTELAAAKGDPKKLQEVYRKSLSGFYLQETATEEEVHGN